MQAQSVFAHFPIVVQTSQFHWGPTPFRSLNCWLEEPSFLDTFKKEWVQVIGEIVEKKLKALRKPLQKWNREVFGRIDVKIKSFQEELMKIDSKAQHHDLVESDWHRRKAL